ncbi:A-deaminase domain-containing protein [Sulfidibacter corallicola]|uniref:Adenosine deaminase n=1 Tax=Sulfidibacter corallicola TaxID=2818388 RepID=A0A8A4TNP4_SULCO|nr:hypothetical protein [Sulfidibacter corallicola]QTD51173.1 hypothetical protein J3U87_01780 [Sulfidibacter corallicola]
MNFSNRFNPKLTRHIAEIISQTNGITLDDTLDLMLSSDLRDTAPEIHACVGEFKELLERFLTARVDLNALLEHPFAAGLYHFFRAFPLPYREEHIHLTGSLAPDFIYPRIRALLDGPNGAAVAQKIESVYGPGSARIESPEDVANLVVLKDDERFDRYLQILMLPKLILTSREAHREAAYHMASTLFHKYNVGNIRLKFTLSRATANESETIPGLETLTSEDVALGLYEGFADFKREQPVFEFILSPCFRKEPEFFDHTRFDSKHEAVLDQINTILDLLEKYPFLRDHLREVDTVGNERNFYRKAHFKDMHQGFRKLQYYGFQVRSHHGETWKNLRCGIQAVDNAMNIWHINCLEHGLSLGINPNFYFHSMYQRVLKWNAKGEAIRPNTIEYNEIKDMPWNDREHVRDMLLRGERLSPEDIRLFTKVKFHTAREIEHYQHDVLNRMIHKKVSLMSLPSSNYKLTAAIDDYKDHPFSWWEKKGVKLGVGTDNYITLNTDFLQEMLILLFTDPFGLKITKLLMITTGEERRPYISHLLWKMNTPLDERLSGT